MLFEVEGKIRQKPRSDPKMQAKNLLSAIPPVAVRPLILILFKQDFLS